jgi:hypothetical protein
MPLLFIPELFLIIYTIIVDEAVVLIGDLLPGSEACARFGLIDPGHGGSRGRRLWVLFLRNGVAGVDPVEVHVYGLCEV